MAALTHPLAHAEQAFLYPEPAPKRAGLTLVDRLDHIQCILDTLDSLDDDEHSPGFREELERELVASLAGTRDKVDRTSAVLAALEAAEEAAASEMERLKTRRDRMCRQKERLESYVLATLTASHLTKLEGHTSTLAARNNPHSVIVDDATAVPSQFLRIPPPPPAVPDKTAIKLALKLDPQAVPGCRLAQTQRLVRS